MKNKYSLDPSNRLIITKNKKQTTVNGNFDIDAKNRLIYFLNEPEPWRRKNGLPAQISFTGRWRLGPEHDLELAVSSAPESSGNDRLRLKANMILAEVNSLIFEIQSRDRHGNSHLRLIKLGGRWQADKHNRLNFIIQKTDPDTLTLEGGWQIDNNQQIIYQYTRAGRKAVQALTFEGFWDIGEKNRLSYVLSGDSRSRFDFHVQAGSPNIYPQQGKIKYALGAGVRKDGRPSIRIVYLYGKWKIGRRAGLSFEMDYGHGRLRQIDFGAELDLDKRNSMALSLSNKLGEPLGISAVFTHKFLKKLDAEAFVRLKTGGRAGSGIDIGARIPF